jgi:hypothetical protein
VLKHFGVPSGKIATAGRQFPITARVDSQSALEELLKDRAGTKLLGILSPNPHEPTALAQTLAGGPFRIDAGRSNMTRSMLAKLLLVRCLRNALWLSRDRDLPFAIMMAPGRFGLNIGVQVEIAAPAGERGPQFSHELFRQL